MTVWEHFPEDQRREYINFLKVYGALTNLFRQKQGDLIPYLDSKFQETVFAKIFKAENVDIGNTPHDVLSVFGEKRIGIGLKTWMGSNPSFQKVMQLKRYQNEINVFKDNPEELALKISEIKNDRMRFDYERLGLDNQSNIYHYITRDKGKFILNECSYPLIDVENLRDFITTDTSFQWSDGQKEYKYTFGDSQIWQKFDTSKSDTYILEQFNIDIIEDPFKFLLDAYFNQKDSVLNAKDNIEEIYLPLYSYDTKDVEDKSGLNAWRASPKVKGSDKLRPLNEIYIPVPKEFHNRYPNFFTSNILEIIKKRKEDKSSNRPEVRFYIHLPNGKKIPALLTGDNLKNFQSGSKTEYDINGKKFGQAALGQWLLIDVLGLKEREKVTRDWLIKKGTDSVRVWREKGDYLNFYIDFAPVGAFEAFMNNEPIPEE